MGKQEEQPTLADILKRMNELEAKSAEKDKLIAELSAQKNTHTEKYARTEGKQPIDEMIDAPMRDPVVQKLISGAVRRDF